MDSLLKDIVDEVHRTISAGVHPAVLALVRGFLAYLREPRYQNPLSLLELAKLFQSFYNDLDSLVIHIYTQLNTNKRLLLQQLAVFAAYPHTFDYLLAIANYSASSIKLVRRTDPSALAQLRIFAFYKAMTVLDTLEKAQYDVFTAGNPGDSILYDKIFRFDERDIHVQQLTSDKLHVLHRLSLPFSCFCDTTDAEEKRKLDEFFLTLHMDGHAAVHKIHASLRLLGQVRTPAAKLKHIVRMQKAVIALLAEFYDNDPTRVNNDILLPALIYILVYHLEDTETTLDVGDPHDLYLNFTFVKHFANWMDPYHVETGFTLATSVLHYNPTDRRRRKSANFYELLNLSEAEKESSDMENPNTLGIAEVADDRSLMSYLQTHFLNTGELQFYLTNFEAILYFLQNTPIKLLVPEEFTIPESLRDNSHITLTVPDILDKMEKTLDKTADKTDDKSSDKNADKNADRSDTSQAEMDRLVHDELFVARPRSSLLFNTISSAVSHVSRSRSNSALKSPIKERDADFESSLYVSPLPSSDRVDNYGLGRVRTILGRFSLASAVQVRPIDESISLEPYEVREKRSLSLFDRISPNHSRTRSGSLETRGSNPTSNTNIASLSNTNIASLSSTNIATAAANVASDVTITGSSTTGNSTPGNSTGTVTANSTGTGTTNVISTGNVATGANVGIAGPNTVAQSALTNLYFGINASNNRRATLTKLSNGVSEFMTKLTAATPAHVSSTSLYYEDSPFEEKRPDLGKRSASLQTMDRWFSNIPENPPTQFSRVDSNNDDSVFSASFGELTRFQHMDFESLTINDLKTLKGYYDQLCLEVMATKTGSKTSNEFLPDDKDHSL